MLKPFFQTEYIEAGIDEAGRGCYAGPVFSAAVILPQDFFHPLLNDSKKLSAAQRNELKIFIELNVEHYAIAMIDNDEIDKINILKASLKAMHHALDKLALCPEILIVDGNRFIPWQNKKHHCIIKGDGMYASIAAASILAKTHRDSYMEKLHEEFPAYGWNENKGYGTAKHRKAIEQYGLCKYHRKSFNIVPTQTELNF